MKFTVRLFARARDLAHSEVIALDLPEGATVADLKTALAAAVPALQPLTPHLLVALGTDYAGPDAKLDPAREIACFPPVSGG